ncbi:flavin-containing monooxygenase [Photorhabdus asymbiotica]|uniref:flavin-containing monooxygenase n=1 Tax=Photorhabdus asymbiotica TaxID=291112 RepID=UPI003DA750D8
MMNKSAPDHNPQTDISQTTDVEIIIIGAGFAGLGMGTQLKRRSQHSFLILERANDVGGTWRDNSYPGIACDIPSHLYSFSFRPNPDWSHVFSPGHEILAYLQTTARDEGLLPHIRLGTNVQKAYWDNQEERWIIVTTRGVFSGRFLVAGTGHLTDENIPQIEGLSSFTGDFFHSARWKHHIPLQGKRVGIIGSGASAAQIIPEIANGVSDLVIFQRSAPYVIPRPDRSYSEAEKQLFRRDPESIPALRADIFWHLESLYPACRSIPQYLAELKGVASDHLKQQISDPELRAKLTPNYEPGCKRILVANNYYPAFLRDNVQLETSALKRIDGQNAISVSGNSYPLDVLIFCTGFQTTQPPYTHLIHGRDGLSLADHWTQGMEAFASTTVTGFPNFFIINGPSASLTHNSIIYIIESQIEYILGAIEYSRKNSNYVLEVSAEAQESYVNELQHQLKDTVWVSGGCTSWYLDPRNQRPTLIWPGFAHTFRKYNSNFYPAPYTHRVTT